MTARDFTTEGTEDTKQEVPNEEALDAIMAQAFVRPVNIFCTDYRAGFEAIELREFWAREEWPGGALARLRNVVKRNFGEFAEIYNRLQGGAL